MTASRNMLQIIADLTSAQSQDETDVTTLQSQVSTLQQNAIDQEAEITALEVISSSLVAGGLGASGAYIKTDNGTKDLLAGNAATRVVLIAVVTTETIADGDGAKPVFTIGEESGSATKFAADAAIGTTAGDVKLFVGTLTATKKLQVYVTAGTGTTETGAISVTVLALPQAA
jgi:hypothetical protein